MPYSALRVTNHAKQIKDEPVSHIYVISPRRNLRAKLMPVLPGMIGGMENVKIMGVGATCVKVEVNDVPKFKRLLAQEILDSCFVQPATQYSLASDF
jgi:hypothetical protein